MIPDLPTDSADKAFNTFLRILNEAYQADADAIHVLIVNRVPCNDALADHPTIQVTVNDILPSAGSGTVGLLGIINGICEPLTGKRVAVQFSEEDPVTKRSKIVGFCEYRSF